MPSRLCSQKGKGGGGGKGYIHKGSTKRPKVEGGRGREKVCRESLQVVYCVERVSSLMSATQTSIGTISNPAAAKAWCG